MELRQLKYFKAACELRNFSEAARLLHISQSTLSQQVKQLEDELDVPLFDRVGKRVVPTEAGLAFLPYATKAIHAAETGCLTIEKLEAMTAGCSVGIDMVIIPGDTTPAVISALIADEAAIGMVNSKTTAVRVIPAIGRKAGEVLDFGGLLGYGPIMAVNQHDPSVFINRGGRLPAPMQSLKN